MFLTYSYDDYQELICTIQIPLEILEQKADIGRYKYYVVTPKTKEKAIESFEFISGPQTRTGKIIDRSLKLHVDVENPKCESKW